MSNLARPASTRSAKVLLLPPAKSVRPEHQARPDRRAFYFAVTLALCVLGAMWVLGHLGFRLGYALIVRVPELTGSPGGDLSGGAMILLSIPASILRAGIDRPLGLLLAFAMIAIPAAGLAAARPHVPGAPRAHRTFVVLANVGGVIALLQSLTLIWWSSSSQRRSVLGPLPEVAADITSWLHGLQSVAGLDALAVTAAVLWTILAFRLPVPRWFRAIVLSWSFFSAVTALLALAYSAGASAHATAPRSVITPPETGSPALVLGSTAHHLALLQRNENGCEVILVAQFTAAAVSSRESVAQFLTTALPAR